MLTPAKHTSHQAGEVLDGRFRLLQQVLVDRTGTVFDALDEATGDVVRLRSTVGPPDPQLLGAQHPGVAHAIGVAADRTYVVFDDHDDEPLVSAPCPSLRRLEALMEAILPTMAVLHRHGVVHGELQPTSFWLDRSGQIRLVDLGLAVPLWRSTSEEPYVAPERAFGREADDPRIDVYALAAILFRHATGMTPVPQHLEASGFPASVVQVLSMAMAPRPLFRPEDAGELYRALQEALERSGEASDDAIDAGPDTLNPPPRTESPAPTRVAKRHSEPLLPWWAALMLMGGIAMLAGTVVFLFAVAFSTVLL